MFDILWQNANGSRVAAWEMNVASIMWAVAPTAPETGWQLKDDGPIPADQMGTAGAADGSDGSLVDLAAAENALPGRSCRRAWPNDAAMPQIDHKGHSARCPRDCDWPIQP